MKESLVDLAGAVRARTSHCFIVHGNVYDPIHLEGYKASYPDVTAFLADLTTKFCPNFLTYDLFAGLKVVRGKQSELLKDLGLARANNGPKDEAAQLAEALKKAKAGNNASPFPIEPLELFTCFDQLLNTGKTATAIVVEYANTLLPAVVQNLNRTAERVLSVGLVKWARSNVVGKNGHLIFLVCRSSQDLDMQLLDRAFNIRQICVTKPRVEEREAFMAARSITPETSNVLAKATAGLSFKELDIIAAQWQNGSDPNLQLANVFALKQKFLSEEYADVIEIMRPTRGFDSLGGLEKPIAKLQKVANAVRNGQTSLVPQGILFSGPPGTGKTILAEALATEAGLNFVQLRDIKSMWVGESERRMTRALEALKDLAPVVVFVDEFDQNQGQRGGFDGDSGTSRNLFKKMLEVMSDTTLRGKILWILATNRPDLIDPAMKRPGRCDLRIPFLPPDVSQLALICKAAFRQYPDMRTAITDWLSYAQRCDGYTGADMVELVRNAWVRACEDGRSEIIEADMLWACDDYRPQVTEREAVLQMAAMAVAECSSRELLPDNYADILKKLSAGTKLGEAIANTVDQALAQLIPASTKIGNA